MPSAWRKIARIFRSPPPIGCCFDPVSGSLSYNNFPISAEPASAANPLVLLKALAAPEDFVVFKLDIDTSAIETSLIHQILEDEELMVRIDELYWEHAV
eukprot:5025261-Prymnesium_polylepis.1